MENVRSEILTSIRRNLAKSEPLNALHQAHHSATQHIEVLIEESSFIENVPLVPVASSSVNLVENFRESLSVVGGNVITVKDISVAAFEIDKLIKALNAKRIALSDSELVGQTKKILKADGEFIEKASAAELFECDLGITSAQFGIAETGTLVLESEKEFNRLTSLVPTSHICLLEAKSIRQTLGEVLATLEKNLSRTITFITGPSRTSDIELTLAIGVHGPAQLFVILVEEN
jgi:L-lactate dehydrogenase complex protein LldG